MLRACLLVLVLPACASVRPSASPSPSSPPPPAAVEPEPVEPEAGLPCPHDGGPLWRELTSPHVTLRSSARLTEAQADVQTIEARLATLQTLADTLLPRGPSLPRLNVLEPPDWHTGPHLRIYKIDTRSTIDERGRPMMTLHHDALAGSLAYELAHRLVAQRLPHAPAWLADNLANYLAEAHFDATTAHLGGPDTGASWIMALPDPVTGEPRLRPEAMMDVATILRDVPPTEDSSDYQVASWALVHYLVSGGRDHAQRFRRFTQAIAAGTDATTALTAAYGPLADLQAHHRQLLQQLATTPAGDRLDELVVATPRPPRVAANVRTLDDGEVHWLVAFLLPAQAADEVALARQHAPQSPATLVLRALELDQRRRFDEALALIDRLVEPRDPFTATLHLSLRVDRERDRPRAERVLAPLAREAKQQAQRSDDVGALLEAARYAVMAGDLPLGLPAAKRATTLDPACHGCWIALSELYYLQASYADALAAVEHARSSNHYRKRVSWEVLEHCYTRRVAGEAVDCRL